MRRKISACQKRSLVDWPKQLAQLKVNFICQKTVFQTSTTLLCWRAENFLRIFHERYAYKKQSLGSNESFSTNQSIIRHVKIIIRQEKAIFVRFKEIISWQSQESISAVQKSFFQNSTRLLFWRVEFFLRIFYACDAYENNPQGPRNLRV